MRFKHLRFLSSVLIAALLPLYFCAQNKQSSQTSPTPYKVYQGTGNIGEEKGGRVCFIYGKEEHCWNVGDYFSEVTAKPVMLPSGRRLILVTALSMGGSDGTIDLALLDEQNQQPVNLLPSVEITSANSGQWDEWQIQSLSPMPIILIANNLWDDDSFISNAESRAKVHHFEITAYFFDAAISKYKQRFEYKSSNKYSSGEDVIALEKQTILAKFRGAAGK